MVVRRFREHIAEHNWFAVAVDVGIVVLGVFIGTQVANWNEDRLEERRAADYRERLAAELEFDAHQYAAQSAYYRQAQQYGLQALADLDGSKPLSDNDFLIATYQLTQRDSAPVKTGVYKEMSGKGLTDRLGDTETQDLATDFYVSVDVADRLNRDPLPYRSLLRGAMPYDLQTGIRNTCGDRPIYIDKRLVGTRLIVPCPLEIEPARAAEAARRIRAVPGLEVQMTRYVAGLQELIDNIDLARDQADGFRKRMQQQR